MTPYIKRSPITGIERWEPHVLRGSVAAAARLYQGLVDGVLGLVDPPGSLTADPGGRHMPMCRMGTRDLPDDVIGCPGAAGGFGL